MTYEQAVELAKKKNEAGFHFLYESTYQEKYYIALKYMQNEEDARDVLQDAYIRAFNKLDTLENAEKFSPWLGMIVANTAKNALAKKKPILFSEMETETENGDSFEFQIEDERIENQPELSYTKEETRELVQQMISSLSDEQRFCILMFYMEDMSIRDIAEMLDCSENTVKSRLNYGRKSLKMKAEELQKKGYKLYGIAPLPLLLYLLRTEGTDYLYITEDTDLLSYENLEKRMKGSSTASRANPVGQTVKQLIHTTAGKVTIGATVAVVTVGTIGAVIGNQSSDSREKAVMASSELYSVAESSPTAESSPIAASSPAAASASVEEDTPAESTEEIATVEATPATEANKELDWKTSYAEVLSNPAEWLLGENSIEHTKNEYLWEKLDTGFYFQALLDDTSTYQYTLFDIDKDGTPELIIKVREPNWSDREDTFFCAFDETRGAYLVKACCLSFREVLAIYEDTLVWVYFEPYGPDVHIGEELLFTEDSLVYSGNRDSAPETQAIEWYSTEDTEYMDKIAK
ncbi:MAG: RNA polymerase sigma factor [Lachnospiraceae bacterium]|nr:RNA polymerase sigma factor [Lachnospiraceae bacterium]